MDKKKNTIGSVTRKRKKVFISHNHVDKVYCDEILKLVTLLIGEDDSKIFYSSSTRYGVPNGAPIIATMKEQYDNYNLFMIILSSPQYYESPKCLNEMGAAWVLNSKCTIFLSPNMKISDQKGVLDSGLISIKIEDNEESRDRLDRFAKDITSFFRKKMPTIDVWDKAREQFIAKINSKYISTNAKNGHTIQLLSDSYKVNSDTKRLNELFEYFSFELMQNYIIEGPEYIDSRIPLSYDAWCNIMSSYTFVIYDEALKSLLYSFFEMWDKIMFDNWQYYETANTPKKYHFYGYNHDRDDFMSKDAEIKFRQTQSIIKEMDPALRQLSDYIINKYEVDIKLLSEKFEKEYY